MNENIEYTGLDITPELVALNKKKMDYYKDWIASAKKEIFIKVFN